MERGALRDGACLAEQMFLCISCIWELTKSGSFRRNNQEYWRFVLRIWMWNSFSHQSGICSSKAAPTLGTAGKNSWGEKMWINPFWCLGGLQGGSFAPQAPAGKDLGDIPAQGMKWALRSFPNQSGILDSGILQNPALLLPCSC